MYLEVRSVMVENFASRSTILKHDHCLAATQHANVIVLQSDEGLKLVFCDNTGQRVCTSLSTGPSGTTSPPGTFPPLLLFVPLGKSCKSGQVEHGNGGADLHPLCQLRPVVVIVDGQLLYPLLSSVQLPGELFHPHITNVQLCSSGGAGMIGRKP